MAEDRVYEVFGVEGEENGDSGSRSCRGQLSRCHGLKARPIFCEVVAPDALGGLGVHNIQRQIMAGTSCA